MEVQVPSSAFGNGVSRPAAGEITFRPLKHRKAENKIRPSSQPGQGTSGKSNNAFKGAGGGGAANRRSSFSLGVSVEKKRVSQVVCSKGLRRNIVTAALKYDDSHPEINENRGGEKLDKLESRKGGGRAGGWGGGAA